MGRIAALVLTVLIVGCFAASAVWLGVRMGRENDPEQQIRIASPLAFLTLGLGFLTLILAIGMAIDH